MTVLLAASAALAVMFYSQSTSGTAAQVSSQTTLPSRSSISGPSEVAMRPPSAKLGKLKSLEEIQQTVDFKIKVPAKLPEGVRFQGAYLSIPREAVQGKSGPYTVTAVMLVYWDKDVTALTTHDDVLKGGGFFLEEGYVPGSTLEDFKRPCCPVRVENGKPMEEIRYYPISDLWGYPAIITERSVAVKDLANAMVYEIYSDSLSRETLMKIMESLVKG